MKPRDALLIIGVWLLLGFQLTSISAPAEPSTNRARLPGQSFLTPGGITKTPQRDASPHFEGTELPRPPLQDSAWHPPAAEIPSTYVSATVALFETGMADPRGCEYREIEVATGIVWVGDGGLARTRGWLLPSNAVQRFAVCWNGLVYPAVTVGASADWREDAKAAMKRAALLFHEALPERYTVSHETCLPLKGCILLRLGEAQLAKEFWTAIQQAAARDTAAIFKHSATTNTAPDNESRLDEADPYLGWASDWAWGLFDRAICAHMRGDDGIALVSARQLTVARPLIESTAERRGFKRQQTFASPWDGKYQDYLPFLSPLPTLLADQERRSILPKPRASLAEVMAMSDKAMRIAGLIELLDEIAQRQDGQPGGVDLVGGEPIVSALSREGQDAIEPLLRCLESDCGNRLTRSVSFHRDFKRNRNLHSVDYVLVHLAVSLMNTTHDAAGVPRHPDGSNAVLASRLRNYWKEYGPLSLPERWYRKLADDMATPGQWGDALQSIVQERYPRERNAKQLRLPGEELRSKTAPSVTELLVRRSQTMVRDADPYISFGFDKAVAFLLNAQKWEPLPIIHIAAELQSKALTAFGNVGDESHYFDHTKTPAVTSMALLRARHGDTKGLDQYAVWIQKTKPKMLDRSLFEALEPFHCFPDYPALRNAASAMFVRANSTWGTLAWLFEASGRPSWEKPIASPLLVVPEIRARVIEELRSQSPAGEALHRGEGNVDVKYADGGQAGWGGREDAKALKVGEKVTFRRGDIVAEQLSAIPRFPKFSILWPESKRDEAIGQMTQLLSESGHRLRVKEKPRHWSPAWDPPLVELAEDPQIP